MNQKRDYLPSEQKDIMSKGGVVILVLYTGQVTTQNAKKAGIPSNQAEEIAKGANLRRCAAMNFVKENKHKIRDITESQQLQLFNNTYRLYVKRSKDFYEKFAGTDAVKWEGLHPRLREVFVDMIFQGLMFKGTVVHFKNNNIESVIDLIKNTPGIRRYREGRKRVLYLETGKL